MFVGRILAEEYPGEYAESGLDSLERIYPRFHFLPFFRGMLRLRQGNSTQALEWFREAEPLQPTEDSRALAAFYSGYSLGMEGRWQESLPHFSRAVEKSPENHAFRNQRGVAYFQTGHYERAAEDFSAALEIDPGSALDMANLGLCYKFSGKKAAAADFLRTSLEMDPSLDFAWNHWQELCKDSETNA